MNILITICARAGSKGIPKKNIKILNGKPLIVYTLELAKKLLLNYKTFIAISSDDKEIIEISKKYGINSDYHRPNRLSGDNVGKVDSIRHLLLYYEKNNKHRYDFILDLDVSSPLRTINDVEKSFEKIKNNNEALSLFSVNRSNKSPYFNMVEKKKNNYFNLVKNTKNVFLSRQNSPEVYDLNASFYWYRRSFFETQNNSPITNKSIIYKMDHICFDIDEPIDFYFLEFLIETERIKGIL